MAFMIRFSRMKYRFLEDIATADVVFEAYGKTLEDLFQNCALALMEVMVDTATVSPSQSEKLKIKSEKLENLLFDFLSELVYLKDAKQILFSKFSVNIKTLHPKPYTLVANLWGEKINPRHHHLRTDVKAVTWHLFKIEKEKKGWRAQVVVDI